MQIKKGPYGIFITETVSADDFSKYAFEIINSFVYYVTVTIYSYEYLNHIELSYDISSLTTFDIFINKLNNSQKKKDYVRKMVGSLISSILYGLDYLLIPSNWLIDIKHIYYDEESDSFRFIYLPTAKGNDEMQLSSTTQVKIEELIANDIVKPYLSDDEINSISYYFKEKNEEKLLNIANNLSKEEEISVTKILSHKEINHRENRTCIAAISILIFIAIINYIELSKTIGLVIAAVALISIAITQLDIINYFKNNKHTEEPSIRKEILFEDKVAGMPDIKYATINSITKINGEFVKKSLLADTVTIGSDCFLSDIVIDSEDISPLHAKISIDESGYTLTDLSKNNTTYLENKRISPNKQYEIKNGELITFGKYDFEFKTSC